MRHPVKVRQVAALAVTPLLMVGLVACGGDDKTSAKDTTNAAASSSPESPGASADESEPAAGETIDPQDFADRISSSFDDSTTAKLAMKVSSSGLAMSATGEVDYTGKSPAMALKIMAPTLGEGTIDMRLVDQVMYMSMPMISSSGKFFKVDLNDPKNPLGDSLGDFTSFDPRSTMETFSKGVKSVRVVGTESLDGVDATHYQVTTSTKDLGKTLGGNTAGLPKQLTYDIWLDGEDRLRKMTADLGKQASVEMEMTDFGADVKISAPPASQVTEMPSS